MTVRLEILLVLLEMPQAARLVFPNDVAEER